MTKDELRARASVLKGGTWTAADVTAFQAAASPEAVTKLLDENDALLEKVKRYSLALNYAVVDARGTFNRREEYYLGKAATHLLRTPD